MRRIIVVLCAIAWPCLGEEPASSTPEALSEARTETSRNERYIPEDLDDCFRELDRNLRSEDIEKIKNGEITAVDMHFGLGMGLRNRWGLWGGSRLAKHFNEMGIVHPDDMSGIILTSYVRYLRNEPIRLDEQVAYYKEYWEKAKAAQEKLEEPDPAAPRKEEEG